MRWPPLLVVLISAATITTASAQRASPGAIATVRTASGQTLASATFTQASGEVLISIAFANRTALVGTHALQIHSGGQCSLPAFDRVGPVLSPSGALPNLVIAPAGVAVYNLSAPNLTVAQLLSGPGTSLVIFADQDTTSGQPIACGVIVAAANRGPHQLLSSIAIGAMGGLLIAAGLVLRRA